MHISSADLFLFLSSHTIGAVHLGIISPYLQLLPYYLVMITLSLNLNIITKLYTTPPLLKGQLCKILTIIIMITLMRETGICNLRLGPQISHKETGEMLPREHSVRDPELS